MQEAWRNIAGYPSYKVSDLGRVKSFARYPDGRLLKATIAKNGYEVINMSFDHKQVQFHIHVLVAEAFIGQRPEGYEVNHKDGNKLNNVVSNLEYLSNKAHKSHTATVLGKHNRGSRSGLTVLTPEQVAELREMYSTGEYTQEQIALRFHVSGGTVSRLVNLVTWSSESVPNHYVKPPNPLKKLTDDDVRKIRQMHASGLNYREIAKSFHVTYSPIGKIIRGEIYKHVK